MAHSSTHSVTLPPWSIDFQPAVPVFQPGYANKSTYWKGGLRASGFHQLPTLPGEQVGPVEPEAKARRQAKHFKVCGASSSWVFNFNGMHIRNAKEEAVDLWLPSQGGYRRKTRWNGKGQQAHCAKWGKLRAWGRVAGGAQTQIPEPQAPTWLLTPRDNSSKGLRRGTAPPELRYPNVPSVSF